jgi:protein-disulfide isomerase
MTYKEKPKNSDKQRQQMILLGMVVAVVLVAGIAIFISSSGVNPSAVTSDYTNIPTQRGADGAFILGNPDAPVKMIAFEDFLCPHCQDYQGTVHQFINKHVATGQAQFEFRLLLTQPNSSVTAQLAECAEEAEEGAFWRAHDTLFQMASSAYFDPSRDPRRFAEKMGLNYTGLLECSGTANQHVVDRQYAQQLGVTGTPTVFIQYGSSAPQKISPPPGIDQLSALVLAGQ